MADQYARILRSDLFTFIVGASKERVVVHSEAVSRLSPALDKLMHGEMREAQTSECTLDDIEAEDFTRFCQFAYMGDYMPPEPITMFYSGLVEDEKAKHIFKVEQNVATDDNGQPASWRIDALETIAFTSVDELAPLPPPPPADYEDSCSGQPAKTTKGRKKRLTGLSSSQEPSKTATLRRIFESKAYDGNRTRDMLNTLCQPVGNDSPKQDFTPVLLSHARLYSLGDKYGIEDLTSLALQKLHRTLVLFRLYDCRIADILQLVRYIYENTHCYSKDPLRVLVSEYVVGSIDRVGKSPNFHSLLEEGGEFVSDFWRLVQEHLL